MTHKVLCEDFFSYTVDGYEKAYNLQWAIPRGPVRRQDSALDVFNVLQILGFTTGAGFLAVISELIS